jgi:predicted Zn-dependent peptidase
VLGNGLRLIFHEDHKAPIVSVNVWYHVGSKNEKAGRTDFAHLFEHQMFNGSANCNDDYFSTNPDKVRGITLADVAAASSVIQPNRMVWVISGDRAKIEPGLKELGLGEIREIDADGNVK